MKEEESVGTECLHHEFYKGVYEGPYRHIAGSQWKQGENRY